MPQPAFIFAEHLLGYHRRTAITGEDALQMRYISTRGMIAPVSFQDAVMMGLANDGGLLLPEQIPAVTSADLAAWSKLSYQDLAFEIISLFATDIPQPVLRDLIARSYRSFAAPQVTPLVQRGDLYILELFHGPTLAFKDVALQLLGNLFEYLLRERGQRMNIVGATSGDTGSAAIHGVRGKDNISIFILHPHLRTSPVQALQMTTVTDANVHNIAVQGTFDDCQNMVKALFNDLEFKERYALGAVNSINWARILAQIVYYFSAWLQLRAAGCHNDVVFSVPTGNFGDIFAGYVAKRMGLPMGPLILATNENNILTRLITEGDYSVGTVVPTLSPSMDIQVASNLERYLYYLFAEDPARVRAAFSAFAANGVMPFSPGEVSALQATFLTRSVDRQATLATIARYASEYDYLLDPHTAVGIAAAEACRPAGKTAICLSTAHPAKFGDAVKEATGHEVPLPGSLAKLQTLPTRCEILPADLQTVRSFITNNAI
jgi:threonine synthase